ncbi:MAG: capsule assembly Wzi family protein [Bacteroides sp.]|nr:capsule assembly Wzi family protein [Bacteroides sp.]MCM1413522.1 capsule assembly Wzi family protein [Bacteroides sp.]MCM1471076.1 capsule assembly Wzi family protein [Bacteroides sp.]
MIKTYILSALLLSASVAFGQDSPDSIVEVVEEVEAIEATATNDTVQWVLQTCPTYSVPATYTWRVEAQGALSSGESTPFWLVNNRWGLSSLDKRNGYLRGSFKRSVNPEKRFDWYGEVDLAVPFNYTSHFVVQQLYAGVKYRSLYLTVGQRQWSNGVVDNALSSGDMLFSTNSRPVPQVMLEMPEYQYVPYTNKWLGFRAYISVGMYTDWRWERDRAGANGSWIKNRMLHTKGLFLRGGNADRFPLTVEGGLEMGAEWGGTFHGHNRYTGEPYTVRMGRGLKDFWHVLFPSGGGDSSDPNQMGEVNNVYGNHVGQWSLAVNWEPKDSPWHFRAYYEHFFDDHSMMFFDHAWKDMLLGIEVSFPKNPVVSRFVYEYIDTKDQSGAVYWDKTPDIPSQVSGRDEYYSHELFTGWQSWGMGQGNPLLISPIYNTPGLWYSYEFLNNRIKGHHFGWTGQPLADLDYRVLLSLTRSWGCYTFPAKNVRHNVNALLELNYHPHQLQGWAATLGLGLDGGCLLGHSFGASLTISKTGWL